MQICCLCANGWTVCTKRGESGWDDFIGVIGSAVRLRHMPPSESQTILLPNAFSSRQAEPPPPPQNWTSVHLSAVQRLSIELPNTNHLCCEFPIRSYLPIIDLHSQQQQRPQTLGSAAAQAGGCLNLDFSRLIHSRPDIFLTTNVHRNNETLSDDHTTRQKLQHLQELHHGTRAPPAQEQVARMVPQHQAPYYHVRADAGRGRRYSRRACLQGRWIRSVLDLLFFILFSPHLTYASLVCEQHRADIRNQDSSPGATTLVRTAQGSRTLRRSSRPHGTPSAWPS